MRICFDLSGQKRVASTGCENSLCKNMKETEGARWRKEIRTIWSRNYDEHIEDVSSGIF